ncbi:RNA polymerase subunit sigma-70 [Streptomyces sp. NBC_01617]|uniref:sigma factor-like helix-turn-helix DNA-binding protein n=1 Tax=Streptomyces sp. NBC_01617 TaxID=2975899 RepID=UPI00386C24D5|nr:RNA polymerase subunit sigma-70 [Streptomyces sp. NBC_01617]
MGQDNTQVTTPSEASWLWTIWQSLDERSRDMLTRREKGQTQEEIGDVYDLSRQRVHQVLLTQEKALAQAADMFQSGWRQSVLEHMATAPVVSDGDLGGILVDPQGVARHALLRQLGLKEPTTWAGRVAGVWVKEPQALDRLLRQIVSQAPFRADELEQRATALGLPGTVSIEAIASHSKSPLTRGAGGHWLRRTAKNRDAAYLWLQDAGEPRRAEDISEAIEASGPRAVGEALRRDERFRQIRPEGTWSLVDWPLPQVTVHTNALDAMVEVLHGAGPLRKRELFARVMKEYPVGYTRLQQCMISDRIGLTRDGLIGLSEDGARPMEEREPPHPANIVVDASGKIIGVRLPVDRNVLRGSGIVVHSWLTWYMGMRLAPMSRIFTLSDGSGDLIVRRSTGTAQLSSLRVQVQSMGMADGCQMVVLLRLTGRSAAIRHVCREGDCAALPSD